MSPGPFPVVSLTRWGLSKHHRSWHHSPAQPGLFGRGWDISSSRSPSFQLFGRRTDLQNNSQSPSAPDETLELPNLGISVAGKNLLQKKKAPSKIHKSLIPGGEGTKLYLSFIYQSEKNSTVRCNTSSVYIWSLSRKRDARGDYKPAKTAFKALPTLLFTRATVIFFIFFSNSKNSQCAIQKSNSYKN